MAIPEAAGHPGIFAGQAYPPQAAGQGQIGLDNAAAGRAAMPALVLADWGRRLGKP